MAFKRKKKGEGTKKLAITIAVVAMVLFCVFLISGTFLPNDKIANHITAGNTPLSGLSLQEAEDALTSDNFFNDVTIEITSQGYSTQFAAQDIALMPDTKQTAQKAFAIGKSKNIFKNACDFYRLLFSSIDVGYIPSVDVEALDNLLYSFGTTFNGEYTDYKVTIADNIATITPRIIGQDPNTAQARNEVLKSIELGVYRQIAVTLNKSVPSSITVDELYELLFTLPIDAEYEYNGNEISIKPHILGVEVEKARLAEAVKLLNFEETATVPVKTITPAITTESLKSKLFNTTLGVYSTNYQSSTSNRAANVILAASKINGVVLKPGDTFSYNESIGDTTIANGYKVAPVFENGKTSEGVGGGICQVSSTLYTAVLYADLKVVERRNHSLTVAYIPKGQDATVSYGSIDFKFMNNTNYPIKISCSAKGGIVNVSLIGTRRDAERTVQLKHNIVSTTEPTTVETQDASLPYNARKVTVTGKPGYVVDTIKTVFENGKEISSEKITRSTYKMVPTEISVGTKSQASVYVVPSPAPVDSTAIDPAPTEKTPETSPSPKPTPTPIPTHKIEEE